MVLLSYYTRSVSTQVLIYMSIALLSACASSGNRGDDPPNDIQSAILKLRQVRLSGYYVGLPHSAMTENDATSAVSAIGDQIVPYLITELDRSDFAESSYIVYCLAKLKARAARQRILKLREEMLAGRFSAENPDLTLETEIGYYREAVAE